MAALEPLNDFPAAGSTSQEDLAQTDEGLRVYSSSPMGMPGGACTGVLGVNFAGSRSNS